MPEIPLNFGTFHFTGIGGIGMSGIAEILISLGYTVQGSDMAENANVTRLRKAGVTVHIGQRAENIDGASVLVISSAIRPDNPELIAARAAKIPVVRRAEMLGELMRLKSAVAVGGTHGKTTTTSMVASMLDAGGKQPTVINGGIVNSRGTNAWLGEGEWLVAEADESDGTFTKLPATVAIVTNIDPEHMEHYGSEDALHAAFDQFVENIPFYGFAVLCIDDARVQSMFARIQDKRLVSYGFSPQADVRGVDLTQDASGARFAVEVAPRDGSTPRRIGDLFLPMVGQHNVSNALSAIAVGLELDMSDEEIREALRAFSGVKRRFTTTGVVDGIRIIDDYGHHPTEITAVLKAARTACDGRVMAIVQPHRYSRLDDHFEDFCTCFNDADDVYISDVYAAGEQPIENRDRDSLVAGLTLHGHRSAHALKDAADLPALVRERCSDGDMVLFLGAGNITQWANALPVQLETGQLSPGGKSA